MKIKVSIRVSILTIFTLLLISIGTLIILVNYYAGNTILLRFTEKLITGANKNVEQQINAALSPMYERIILGSNTIKSGLIRPAPSANFTKFFLQLLVDQPEFSGVHWSEPNGNFNFIERNTTGTNLTHQKISCNNQHCTEITQQLDRNGQLLSQTPPHNTSYDPRTRPWYIKAIEKKTIIYSDLYTFYHRPGLGLTAANPIYDENGNLYGVLGIDLRLKSIIGFVNSLKLTPNSHIFIFTADNTLLSSKTLQNNNIENKNIVPKISDITIPWVTASIAQYKKTGSKLFSYKYEGQQYLAYYDNIQNIVDNQWYIAIVLPVKDVTAPLTTTLTNSAVLTIATLLLGILLISIVSKRISRPIIHSAQDAQNINNLELDKVSYDKLSFIKEIYLLQEAFIVMKQSLSSFIRYVPFTLVKKLMSTGDIAHVGGDNKDVTFLFVDIEGFTTLSEDMEPRELTKYLSEYFEAMTKIILSYQGTLDKYIGDAIMSFWGAPIDDNNHQLHACQCAIAILNELNALNRRWQQENKPVMKIRIGIHSGSAVVGNVGSNDRLSYTAIGDNVNLASRLENLNKLYNTTIIVSDSTYQAVKNNYTFRFLDHVTVRGKHKAVYLYELITSDHPLNAPNININDYNEKFMAAFTAYQQANWDSAIALFTDLAALYPTDTLSKLYLERCMQFKNNAPADWQGICRLT